MFFILNQKSQKENEKVRELIQNYKKFIIQKNDTHKASSKNFYIIIKEKTREFQKEEERTLNEKISKNNLKENFFKIKEALSRCGNIIYDINDKKETISILSSFISTQNIEKEE